MRLALLGLVLAACGGDLPGDAGPTDAGAADASLDAPVIDAPDAARLDAALPAILFEDVTRAAGIDLFRVPAEGYGTIADRISGGVCVLDADGRGAPDLFFAMRGSDARGASRLYVADAALTYADETAARGLADLDAIGCLALDADGDGDDDLLISSVGRVEIWIRSETGSFALDPSRIVATLDPRTVFASATAGDLTGDGRIDLAVAGYVLYDPDALPTGCDPAPCAAEPQRLPGAPSVLLVQGDAGRFVDRTAELAPALTVGEHALVVAAVDLTDHGALDLFVGTDLGTIHLERALRRGPDGVLRDVAFELGLAADRRGYGIDSMGYATGDVDLDGRPDHVVTSFEADDSALFVCGEDGFCEDRSLALGLDAREASFRWGAALVDLDLDGDLDLVEATGHFYTEDEIARRGFRGSFAQPPNVFLNDRGAAMIPIDPDPADALATARTARGIAISDLDDDGRPDVILAPAAGSPAILHNVIATEHHWLRVRLPGAALGARVTVRRAGAPDLVRSRVLGEGFVGSSDARLHFGVGDARTVDVEVRWPGGEITTREGIATDADLALEP